MAGKYTIHEREVPAVPLTGRDHKMIVGPGRFGDARHMCFGVADFPAESQAPGHAHAKEEEIIYVMTGHGRIFFDGVPEPVERGTSVYVPPGVEHSIKNESSEVMRIIYVFSPPVEQGSYEKK